MIAPLVLAELRRPAVLYDEHYATKYRHPLRKLTTFALLEGPATALRKSRSKLAERRIERAQELVLAGLRGSRGPLLGVTRDLGGALTFDPALVFAAREGAAEPARVALPQAVQLLLEAYLPVPACPLAPQLRDAILSANPWLEPATAEDMVAAAPVGGAASHASPSAQPSGRRVYLVGCGGYVREQVLPHFRGLVAGAVDHKAALILRHAAPGFPIWSDRGRLLDELSREESPLVIVSRPATMRSSVDLPHPDGPTSTMNSRSRMARSIPSITDVSPNRLVTFSSVTPAIAAPPKKSDSRRIPVGARQRRTHANPGRGRDQVTKRVALNLG